MTSARDFCRAVNPNFERKDPSTSWSEPKYPGDTVRIVRFERDGELGDVRIQHYGVGAYRVASFCPGYETSYPGDSPKMNPEDDRWCETVHGADTYFDWFVSKAKVAAWKVLTTPTGRSGPASGR